MEDIDAVLAANTGPAPVATRPNIHPHFELLSLTNSAHLAGTTRAKLRNATVLGEIMMARRSPTLYRTGDVLAWAQWQTGSADL